MKISISSTIKRLTQSLTAISAVALLSGCSTVGKHLNPFQQPTDPIAYAGERTDKALNGTKEKELSARKALEQMASYKRAHSPQPVNPVMQPAVVRLMWIPDHLNSHGDLVPAHYYYLKVLKERWAVSDAFELEEQLGPKKSSSSIPYIYEGKRRKIRTR
ncbi:MAG: hypothetical protein D6808_04430 [Candidatus Dadabacteria bacterium]|nr:MAG: hypothetical protein D6808_04430 [Candidatus Dadabacteria bacterium]